MATPPWDQTTLAALPGQTADPAAISGRLLAAMVRLQRRRAAAVNPAAARLPQSCREKRHR